MIQWVALVSAVFLSSLVWISATAQTDDATVTATVTVQNIAVSVNQASFAYGAMSANTASSTLTLFSGAGIVATNDGSLADFDIFGADTNDWTLNSATSTADNYIHKFCNETANNCSASGVFGADFTALTTSPQTLSSNVAADGTVAFQLSLHTPNPSTVFTEQSAVVTVQASAP
ncbi:MAG TPA: hypothetical protein VJI33_04865 [Candidatus Paceibacterota bacterium]